MNEIVEAEVFRQVRESDHGTGNKENVAITANTQRGLNHTAVKAFSQMLKGPSNSMFSLLYIFI